MKKSLLTTTFLCLNIGVCCARGAKQVDKKPVTLDDAISSIVLDNEEKTTASNGKEVVVLTEEMLKELANNDVPSIEKINMAVEQANVARAMMDENFATKLKVGLQYSLTDGKTDSYVPATMENSFNYNAEITKDFARGISLGIGTSNVAGKYKSLFSGFGSGTIDGDYNHPVLSLSYSMDLWKNFLGYTNTSKIKGLTYAQESAKVKSAIEKNNFFINLRKIYWNLVVLSKQIKLHEYLTSQAEKSCASIEKRYKMSAVDKGDLARSRSMLESRRANLSNYQYQYRNLMAQLTTLLPELNGKEVVLGSLQLEDLASDVLQCNRAVFANPNSKEDTLYTKYIELTDKQLEYELKSLKRYGDPELKLSAGFDMSSYGKGLTNSYNELGKAQRYNFYIGLNLVAPIDGKQNKSEKAQLNLARMNHNSNKNDILSSIDASHESFRPTMEYLFATKNHFRDLIDNLSIRVNSSREKYNQGRISLNDLITDEDSLAEASVQIIAIYNAIVNNLLDYLAIFGETECGFNIKL